MRFVAAPPPVDPLPRMDIAVLAGFAAEGPLHVPVAVESAAEFAAIFGEDALLAWDAARGEPVYAHLGPAVRAFFRNGGRRCWVVRVAGRGASANVFPITGLLRASGDELTPAVVRARSEGSFSDGLRVGAALLASAVTLEKLENGFAVPPRVTLATNASSDLAAGDLLRFTFRDAGPGADADAALVWMLPVTALAAAEPGDTGTLRPGQARTFRVTAQGERSYWFHAGAPASLPAGLAADTFDGEGKGAPVPVEARPPPRKSPSWKGGEVSLVLTVPLAEAPARGSFLRVDLGDEELWVRTRDVRLEDAKEPESTSVTGPALRRRKTAASKAELDELVAAVSAGKKTVLVERLRMELWTRQGDAPPARLSDLGLGQRHPRFWGGLPTDDELYRAHLASLTPGDDGLDGGRWAALWQAAASPRYPLASDGQPRPSADAERESFYLPIGMAFTADAFLGAAGPLLDAPVRNGLETLGAELFLDDALAETTTTTLLAEADFLRYQSTAARPLRGIHAALVVEEATLIAAPDAVHRRWSTTSAPAPALPDEPRDGAGFGELRTSIAAPLLTLASAADRTGAFTIAWQGTLAAGQRYVVEESRSGSFAPATTVVAGTAAKLALRSRATGDWYYRVRVEGTTALGPWSDVLAVHVPADFRDCRTPLDAPVLSLSAGPDAAGTFTLAWTGALDRGSAHVPGERFVVEESPNLGFEPAASVYTGKNAQLTIWGQPQGAWRYRVRIENAAGPGPWSDALSVQVGRAAQVTLEDATAYRPEDLLRVQQALLRMSAARGDLLAVLGMPEHYREPEAIDHAARLAGRLGPGEMVALSHGALYHPWLLTREEPGMVAEIRRTPPDGAIAGLLARRALARGAWIAPANEPLAAVVALTPLFGRDSRQALQDAQINLIRQEPGGFVVLDADTLSADADLVPIHVRRMLSLLRRAALRLGTTYVFEPNDRSFRRLVQRGFEALLGLMFARGAFAGSNEASSFQVVPDDGPSTGAGAAEGCFSVDLRVAPAAPMTFLTIRLVQNGDLSRVTEVR
ncbi:hypothetical protein [Sorangium sp. So ce1151]|uniref:hypothetical protein n=1 Tax=Sorangium sp. So ce1151 TaxID=3133332 RepID=UPI003F617F32